MEIRFLLQSSELPSRSKRLWVEHTEVIRVALRALCEHNCDHVPILKLATAADVSERTLRNIFHDYFGMSPHRYLRIRALNLAHRALLRATVDSAPTVTEVATRFGFWELGHFSHDYKLLFNENPSETLHRRIESNRRQGDQPTIDRRARQTASMA